MEIFVFTWMSESVVVNAGHHPDLHLVGWNNVTVDIWTHAVGKNYLVHGNTLIFCSSFLPFFFLSVFTVLQFLLWQTILTRMISIYYFFVHETPWLFLMPA